MFTETLISGRKYRKCVDQTPGQRKYEWYSFITLAKDILFNDGETAEFKFNGFKGITTNENQSTGYVPDITLFRSFKNSISENISRLNDLFINVKNSVDSVRTNMGGLRFYENETGKYVVGADSVPKKLGDSYEKKIVILTDESEVDPNFSKDANEVQYRNSSTYHLGIFETVYVGLITCNTAHYGAPGEGNPEVWNNGVGANYDKSTGNITVRYGGNLYQGGGNSCKLIIFYKE